MMHGQKNIKENIWNCTHSTAPILMKHKFVRQRWMKVSCTYFWRIQQRNVGH